MRAWPRSRMCCAARCGCRFPSVIRGDGATLFDVSQPRQRRPGPVSLHRLHDQEPRHSRLYRSAHGPALDCRAEGNRAGLHRRHRSAKCRQCQADLSELRILVRLFDALDVGIIVLDQQRRIVGWNDWMARVSAAFQAVRCSARACYDVFPALRATRGCRRSSRIRFEVGSSSILTHSLNKLLPLRGEGGQGAAAQYRRPADILAPVESLPAADQ